MSSFATADGFELLGGDPALEDANQMDNTELRLAIKQIPKARSKLEKIPPGFLKSRLLDELERSCIVLAMVSVPRGGCVFKDEGVAPTVAAMSSRIAARTDLLVLVVHTLFVQNGFVCQCASGALPKDWKGKDGVNYSFSYTHAQINGTRVVLKAIAVDGMLAFHATAQGSKVMHDFEMAVDDFVVPTKLPKEGVWKASNDVPGTLEYAKKVEDAVDRVAPLRDLVDVNMLSPLLGREPKKKKSASLQVKSVALQDSKTTSSKKRPGPQVERQNPEPVFERQGAPAGRGAPAFPATSVGHDDLGPNLTPRPVFPGQSRGGGSLVGPGHPMFQNRRPANPDNPFYSGIGGVRPPGVPPGAKFDPFGPGVPQPFGGPRGGRRGPTFGAPDNDHMRMPGFEGDQFF